MNGPRPPMPVTAASIEEFFRNSRRVGKISECLYLSIVSSLMNIVD
jgi:hypothetical protein